MLSELLFLDRGERRRQYEAPDKAHACLKDCEQGDSTGVLLSNALWIRAADSRERAPVIQENRQGHADSEGYRPVTVSPGTLTDCLALALAAASLIATCVIARASSRLQKALIESQVYEHVSKARLEFEDLVLSPADESDPSVADARDNAWYVRLLAYLKALDDACSRYISRKVDRKWFERQYRFEICDMMSSDVGVWLSREHASEYVDLRTVCHEWGIDASKDVDDREFES